MRIQYKHQKFQADAAKAVVDVFAGQPYLTPSYMMDRGSGYIQQSLTDEEDYTGWSNHRIIAVFFLRHFYILPIICSIEEFDSATPAENPTVKSDRTFLQVGRPC